MVLIMSLKYCYLKHQILHDIVKNTGVGHYRNFSLFFINKYNFSITT